MTQAKRYELKHNAFVVLGLVAEDPNGDHPYNVNKKMEDRGMKDWTNIGVDFSLSTVYRIMERLEEDGLVESFSEEVDNRERKVYQLTDLGWNVLHHKIYTVLNEFMGKKDEDFYVAFSMFPFLSKNEQIDVFTHSLEKIKEHKFELKEMLKENAHCPINVVGLFRHPIKILQADIEFLEWVLKNIKEGKNNYGPEAYYK
jgi:DNA-binding PadR family transcriptional regulator